MIHYSTAVHMPARCQRDCCRHYHTLWSLIVTGKRDVVDATKVFNLETGCLLSPDSPLLDNQVRRCQHKALVRRVRVWV